MDIFDTLTKICQEQVGADADALTRDTTFDDLGLDSLDLVEIIMAVEETFGTEIPEEAEGKIKNLGDLADYLSENSL